VAAGLACALELPGVTRPRAGLRGCCGGARSAGRRPRLGRADPDRRQAAPRRTGGFMTTRGP